MYEINAEWDGFLIRNQFIRSWNFQSSLNEAVENWAEKKGGKKKAAENWERKGMGGPLLYRTPSAKRKVLVYVGVYKNFFLKAVKI